MATIKAQTLLKLQKIGHPPLPAPEEITFGGNIRKQKMPGNHHLPEFRKTGTYYHPVNVNLRKRSAVEAARRLLSGKMNERTLEKWKVEWGTASGLEAIKKALKEHDINLNEDRLEEAESNAEALEETLKAKQGGGVQVLKGDDQETTRLPKIKIEKPEDKDKEIFTGDTSINQEEDKLDENIFS